MTFIVFALLPILGVAAGVALGKLIQKRGKA